MNGKPHSFKGTEGVVGLKRWFEKMEQVFEICKCAEDDKVKFAMCTFEGHALTWWNGNVQTLGLANANQIPYTTRTSVRKAREPANEELVGRAYVVVENPQQNIRYVVQRFDVIIGMDWLAYHRALIDCYEKIVRIPLPNGKILEVQGERPEKDLRSLACIKADEKKLDDIRVVRDYPEVFPDDLLGLPLVREIEFRIDLIPGASPVVRSPYRLAPSEMLELSNQLKEYTKGFYSTKSLTMGSTLVGVRKEKLIMDEAHTSEIFIHPGAKDVLVNLRDLVLVPVFSEALVMRLDRLNGLATTSAPDRQRAYHPQTDGQSERTIQTLEDMLRACVMDFGGSWDTHLPLIEFSYNNSYHTSIKCAPFEALYGRKCRSPVIWTEVGESQLIGPEIVQETTEKIVQIKERLKTARSRQKSYADKRRKPLEFQVGDRVLLKVSPWKGVVRFGKKGKLAPRYVGPFEIVERVGPVAYRLKLPQELSCVHDTFHVSNLKKCLAEPDVQVPLDEIEIDENLRFVEEPIEIVERDVKKLKRRRIPLVKVRWNSRQGAEYTWEREDQFRKKYPNLFSEPVPSSDCTNQRITSITINGKTAYELKGKFLDDLRDNAFSGTNGEDAVEHIEYFLKTVDPIDLPNVNYERIRLVVFAISLVGNAANNDDEHKITEIFRIETNLFDYETPLCTKFNEFNYLLKVDTELFTHDIKRAKTYEDYLNEWNNEVDEPRFKNGVPYEIWIIYADHTQRSILPMVLILMRELVEHAITVIIRKRRNDTKRDDEEEYVAIKEYEYDDLTRTDEDACHAYPEIFHNMDEGWLVTRGNKELKKSLT
ncbi:putative reverse transcriptase domain-containing protein [Tanacetum coccineum]|uniref:Reverse transcriptase domain-containing protein n=1 Tax=Tanacetum coccineum TaxID=301880 RepID=A0ABQ5F551_9ASTR